MKKVMMALFALAISCGLQAATFNWGAVGNVIGREGVKINDYEAMCFVVSTGTDMSSIWSAIAGGSDATTLAGYADAATSNASGVVAARTLDQTSNGTHLYASTTTYDVYIVVFDGKYFTYSNAVTRTTPDWSDPIAQNVAAPFVGAITAGNTWQEIVPEPTSLALLALGVAAIGLRRKVK